MKFDTRTIGFIVVAALVICAMVALSRCGRSDPSVQATQTSASAEAVSNAASVAIETIGNRTVTDAAVDDAVAVGQVEIANATDPGSVRTAVLDAVCGSPAHSSDPACK